jgi:hypothetical protein
LSPLRWAAQPVAKIIKSHPTLLQYVFAVDRPRMHVIGLALAHVSEHQASDIAPLLFTGPVRNAVRAVLGRCPAGIPAVLHRLPVTVLSRDGYRQLIDLLDDPASAKILHHLQDKEIADWMITVLHEIPAVLRPVMTTVMPHLAVLYGLPAALRWLAARGAAPNLDALVADLATQRQPAQLVARLNQLMAELPLPETLPPKVVGKARRIDAAAEISTVAKQFENCVAKYLSRIDDGCSAVYVWDEPELAAVCHVGRHGRLGWALDAPLGPRNADLNEDDSQRITRAFARAGIPEVDIVQTIEAIAYVKLSRRDRLSSHRQRQRYAERARRCATR